MRSLEHDTLARRGLVWFAARCGSFRGAHEVQVAPQYVADAACLGVLYHSEFRKLLDAWGLRAETIRYTLDDNIHIEGSDVPDYFSVVFEAKATRADFLSTFGGRDNSHANRNQPVAHLHYVVTQRGVCETSEVPVMWGHLIASGGGLRCLRHPTYNAMPEIAVLRLAERLLWNRGNQAAARISAPVCVRCRQETRKPLPWNAIEPAHLMEHDPSDEPLHSEASQ